MSKIVYYNSEDLEKLKSELNHLVTVERISISKQIAEARDKGDLSENAEYDAAKEAQGLLEMKISKMEETLSNARLIDESQLDTSKILVLSTVKLKNQANGMEMKYTLVAENEALSRPWAQDLGRPILYYSRVLPDASGARKQVREPPTENSTSKQKQPNRQSR